MMFEKISLVNGFIQGHTHLFSRLMYIKVVFQLKSVYQELMEWCTIYVDCIVTILQIQTFVECWPLYLVSN